MATPVTQLTSSTATPVVFISSTVQDLADLRAGIGYVLRQRGVTVLMSEASDFPLHGHQSAIGECLENVRSSDLYVLILDKRQGIHYEPGVSVTRQEMRVARETFATKGRPHQLLFARRGFRQLVRRTNASLLTEGVDDPTHFRSFIKEIRNPPNPSVPNFLKEFESFEEILDSIIARLNLGKNVAESLARRTLLTELTRNLAFMVNRVGSSALAKHATLTAVQEDFDFRSLGFYGNIKVNESQRTRIVMGLLDRVKASSFETDALRNALTVGVFLDYEPSTGEITETNTHRALVRVLDDVTALGASDRDDWDTRLLLRLASPYDHYDVPMSDLASAFAFSSKAENLFNQMVTAAWLLMGSPYGHFPAPRLPITPFGPEMDLKIRQERVEPWEVESLFSQDIKPFGQRVASELAEETAENRVEQMLETTQKLLASHPQLQITVSDLRRIAEDAVARMTAAPGEGIHPPSA